MCGEICFRDGSTGHRSERRDFTGKSSTVERFGTATRNFAQRRRMIGEGPHVSGRDHASARRECVVPTPELLTVPDFRGAHLGATPPGGGHRSNWKSVGRIGNRRFKEHLKWEAPELGMQVPPRRRCTRNRDRQPTICRDLIQALRRKECGSVGSGAPAGCVKTVHLCAIPDKGERVTSDAVGRRFDDSQCDCGGQGRIDGIATTLQHLQARLGGEGFTGRNHAPAGDHRLATRRIREGVGFKVEFHVDGMVGHPAPRGPMVATNLPVCCPLKCSFWCCTSLETPRSPSLCDSRGVPGSITPPSAR